MIWNRDALQPDGQLVEHRSGERSFDRGCLFWALLAISIPLLRRQFEKISRSAVDGTDTGTNRKALLHLPVHKVLDVLQNIEAKIL